MSRWIIAAAVDMSVIFTSTVAAIPSHIYEQERSKKMQCFDRPKQENITTSLTIDPNTHTNESNHEAPNREILKPE